MARFAHGQSYLLFFETEIRGVGQEVARSATGEVIGDVAGKLGGRGREGETVVAESPLIVVDNDLPRPKGRRHVADGGPGALVVGGKRR